MSSDTVPNLVSIIIPTYNRAELVIRAVHSALAQNHPRKQIIVVDDGSADDTAERMSAFKDIEYYRQENQGQSAARNKGLTKANGEFVTSLDSDDFWHPTFLSESIECLAKTGAGFSFANWEIQGPMVMPGYKSQLHNLAYMKAYTHQSAGSWFHLSPTQTRDLFVRHGPAPSASTVIRRSLIQHGWNSLAHISDDRLLLLDAIFQYGTTAAFTFDRLWTKWLDGSNICDRPADKIKLAQSEIHDRRLILKKYERVMTNVEKAAFRSAIARSYLDFGYHQFVIGNRIKAADGYLRSFLKCPSIQPLLGLSKVIFKPRK